MPGLQIVSKAQLIENFGLEIAQGRGALFIGSGLSSGAGRYPTWETLLESMRNDTNVPGITNYPLLAEYIIRDLNGGRAAFDALLLKRLRESVVTPSLTQKVLTSLPVRDWWTTNYDCLLEATGANFAVVHKNGVGLGDSNLARQPRLVKMHGSLHPEARNDWACPPVISRSDYERFETDHPRVWALLTATFLTKPFLFLGFGFQDPNIDLMLRLSRSLDRATAPQHYAVIRRPVRGDPKRESPEQFDRRQKLDAFRVADLEESGIAVCLIDDYDENKEIVQSLARRTRAPAVYVAGSFESRHPPEEHPQVVNARRVGKVLAQIKDLQIRSLAGASAVQVTEAFAKERRGAQRYDAAEMIYYFRGLAGPPPKLPSRTGVAVYTDFTKEQLQHQVVSMCRLVLVIAGSRDTEKEAIIAMAAGIPVIPLPRSGGTAAKMYKGFAASELLSTERLDKKTEDDWLSLDNDQRWQKALIDLITRFGYLNSESSSDPSRPLYGFESGESGSVTPLGVEADM